MPLLFVWWSAGGRGFPRMNIERSGAVDGGVHKFGMKGYVAMDSFGTLPRTLEGLV